MATTGEPKYGFENVATAAMLGHCARTPMTVARMSLRVASCRQHIPPWKSSTECRTSISPFRRWLPVAASTLIGMTPPRHLREEPEELKHGYP